MGLAAYESGETLEQIVNDCERITSNPGLNLDPTTKVPPIDGFLDNAPAYRWLRDIIRNLYLEHDWHFAIQARTVPMAGGSDRCLLLPDDFWRVAYDNPLYGLIQASDRFLIRQITRAQFFDQGFNEMSRVGRPLRFYLSRPDGLIYLGPKPDQNYAYELHYFRLVDAGTSITSVAQFPFKDLLRSKLLVMYYKDQDDDRIGDEMQMQAQMWMQIRGTNYDMREEPLHPQNVLLDSQWFPNPQFED